MSKKYVVPVELWETWNRMLALLGLRDRYVKKANGYKKAVKAGTQAEACRSIFWSGISELYPEIRDSTKRYDRNAQVVFVETKESL